VNLDDLNENEINSELKEKMNDIIIPGELSDRIRTGVEKAVSEIPPSKNPLRKFTDLSRIKKAGVLGSVAAALVICVLTYNFMPVFLSAFRFSQDGPALNGENNITAEYNATEINIAENRTGIALSSVGRVTITPMSYTDDGVAANSLFRIETADEFSKAELLESLSVRTGESFTIIQADENNNSEFILSFDEPLDSNKIYNIEYRESGNRPLSFAFQTEENFRLLSVFPANAGDNWWYNVPADTVIELTFSEDLSDDTDLSDYVTVFRWDGDSPVQGRWEKSEASDFKYIFFPSSPLEYGQSWNIVVKSGVVSKSGEISSGEHRSRFTTVMQNQNNDRGFLDINGNVFESFLPDDEIFVAVAIPHKFYDLTYKAEIYEINSDADFAELLRASSFTSPRHGSGYWWWQDFYSLNYDDALLPADRTLVDILEKPVFHVNREDHWGNRTYLMLERTLPEGYYAVVISVTDEDIEYKTLKLIQITNFAIYIDSIGEDIVAWVNDAGAEDISRAAVGNARINYGGAEVFTDRDGVAVFKHDNPEDRLFAVRAAGLKPYYTMIQPHEASEVSMRSRYYNYLYTDRRLYRPTDMINIFGCIRPRMGFEPPGGNDEIYITLGNIHRIPVTLDDYGVFAVELPIADYHGWGGISLIVNGEEINWAWFQFLDYDNLMYNIDISTDRAVYAIGDEINITAAVTLFDGTPAPNVEFNITTNPWSSEPADVITARTDSAGVLRASFRHSAETVRSVNTSAHHWQPYNMTIAVSTAGIEERQELVYHWVTIAPRDVMLETTTADNTIEVALSQIDIERLNEYARETPGWLGIHSVGAADAMRSAFYDAEITVQIRKQYTTKTNIRYEYDRFEQRNVERYDTHWHNYVIETRRYNTTNGRVTVTNLPLAVSSADEFERVSYSVDIIYNDIKNRPTEAGWISYPAGNAWQSMHGGGISSIRRFRFDNEDNEPVRSWYGYYSERLSLRVGESIRLNPFEITDYWGIPVKMDAGKSLGVVTQDRLLKTLTSDNSAAVTFTMYEEWLPNAAVGGAYFDGRKIFSIQPAEIGFDYSERTLDISVEFDKEIYMPGEEVTVRISLTDESGNAKQGSVNLMAVDEAAIQAAGEYHAWRDFPQVYYEIKHFNLNRTFYVSYTQHEFNNWNDGAMGNGGSDAAARSDFRDNPAFITVATNESGIAEIKFTLAEALTTWRITAHAVTKDDHVGKSTEFITTQLPLYVDAVMANEFIEGDDISVYVRCFGTEYDPFDNINIEYTVEITQNGNIVASESAIEAGARHFNLGKLPEGEYIIRIAARYGEYSDAVELPFNVIKSGVRLNLSAYEILNEDNPVLSGYDITAGPVRVSLTNSDMEVIFRILHDSSFSRVSSTNRTDRAAAGVFSRHYMQSLGGDMADEKIYINEFWNHLRASGIHGAWNGLPEIAHGNPDLSYSARFAAVYPEFFRDDNSLEHYFAAHVYDIDDYRAGFMTRIDPEHWHLSARSAAFLGLAALGVPVLNDIYRDLDILEVYGGEYLLMLHYAAALTVLGDHTGAWNLINSRDFSDGSVSDQDKEHIAVLELFINTTINPEAALEYVNTQGGRNEFITDSLELIYFVKNYIPAGEGVHSSVRYTLDGKEEHITLTNHDFVSFVLSREQFEEFNLTNTGGSTGVYIDYIGSAANLNEEYKNIEITRTVNGELAMGNTVEIIYDIRLPAGISNIGGLTVSDRLPSNMRFQSKRPDASASAARHFSANSGEKQFVDISVYHGLNSPRRMTVSYHAIITGTGEYIFEPAYIRVPWGDENTKNMWGSTERISVNCQ
jgi:hypothetical protein